MDVLLLSRLQFAVATYFHFLFVPLTLGLSILLAIMETTYVRTGDPGYKAMTKFWGRIFLINFVIGVATGITLEFQFGTNWSRYSRYVGDIFGPLLAVEATVAFFLESTFIAVWAFGWKRLSPRVHAMSICLVAIAANISAFWILIANSWMQSPVGFVMKNGETGAGRPDCGHYSRVCLAHDHAHPWRSLYPRGILCDGHKRVSHPSEKGPYFFPPVLQNRPRFCPCLFHF